ncbi:MAG: hypothetical protein U0930_23360 [Pirellulales bacterium]
MTYSVRPAISMCIKQNIDAGPQLQRVGGDNATAVVSVGDELVVRIVLRVDRYMEYVHLEDHRGSGIEPVKVLPASIALRD